LANAVAVPASLDHSAFQHLWLDALRRYKKKTGVDLPQISYTTRIVICETVDDVLSILKEQDKDFSGFRRRGKMLRDTLAPVVRLAEHCNSVGGEAAAVALVRGRLIRVLFLILHLIRASCPEEKPFSSLLEF
jgi:hypothetical protein